MTAVNRSYFYANGKRKSSRATVRVFPGGKGDISVNDKSLVDWADTQEMVFTVMQPLNLLGEKSRVDVIIRTSGGGKRAQADAARLGISRALLKQNSDHKLQLKDVGFLTRDERSKERKKPGLKRARRAPQFSKR